MVQGTTMTINGVEIPPPIEVSDWQPNTSVGYRWLLVLMPDHTVDGVKHGEALRVDESPERVRQVVDRLLSKVKRS